jgi:hypothetical protein
MKPILDSTGEGLRVKGAPNQKMAQSADELAYDYDKIPVEQVVTNEPQLPATALRLPKVYGTPS